VHELEQTVNKYLQLVYILIKTYAGCCTPVFPTSWIKHGLSFTSWTDRRLETGVVERSPQGWRSQAARSCFVLEPTGNRDVGRIRKRWLWSRSGLYRSLLRNAVHSWGCQEPLLHYIHLQYLLGTSHIAVISTSARWKCSSSRKEMFVCVCVCVCVRVCVCVYSTTENEMISAVGGRVWHGTGGTTGLLWVGATVCCASTSNTHRL